jgi:hypothetical protein
MLEDEVKEKAGLRYDREKPSSGRYSRWGSNPGSISLGEEKVKIKVLLIHPYGRRNINHTPFRDSRTAGCFTNLIEDLNSQLRKYIGRAKHWMNSDMRSRWMATALLQTLKRMRKVNNHKKLHLLRMALKTELKIKQKKAA